MGMFNRITIWGTCLECGTLLNEWQTKSAEVYGKYPVANLLVDIEFSDLSAGDIYTSCPTCRAWIEFSIEEQVPVRHDKERDRDELVKEALQDS